MGVGQNQFTLPHQAHSRAPASRFDCRNLRGTGSCEARAPTHTTSPTQRAVALTYWSLVYWPHDCPRPRGLSRLDFTEQP